MIAVNLLICAVLAGLRVAGHKSVPFQAFAHVYVGGLFVVGWLRLASLMRWRVHYSYPMTDAVEWRPTRAYWRMAWAVSLVELATALYQRGFFG